MEIATRRAFRAQLTKLIKSAKETLESNESDIDKLDGELSVHIERLNAVYASVKSIDQQILAKALIKPEDHDTDAQKVAEYEDLAVTILARLNLRLKAIHVKSQSKMNGDSNNVSSNNGNTKLPKLQLKRFSGDMREWLPFWEQFDVAVHQNLQLSEAEKFYYLEGSLVGAAKRVVDGFTATSSCYEAAVSLLKEQYGDTEKIIDNHMQKLIALRPVTTRNDAVGLRNLYNTITTSIRTLTALKVPTQQYDVMLKTVLLRCMPVELRVDYHRRSPPMS